jgi:hypothetical protein
MLDLALIPSPTPGPIADIGWLDGREVLVEHFAENRFYEGEAWIHWTDKFKNRDILVLEGDHRIKRGASGGAVFNEKKELVGIITARGVKSGCGYATGPTALHDFLEHL